MPSFSHLIFVIAIWSSLANATPTVEQGNSPQPKQDNCGLGYGKVNAKDCTSALQVQVPGQIDDTLRQYVPRLSWNDRTSTGLTLPVENTPKSWHYGSCSLGLVNLDTHLGPLLGVEQSSWWDIHTAFEDIINNCVVGRGTGGSETVGTNNRLIVYIHNDNSKVRSMLSSDAVRTHGICPTDFISVNTPQTCPTDQEEQSTRKNGVTYCETGNGQANGHKTGCSSGMECAQVLLQQAAVLMGTLEINAGTCS